MGSSDTQGGDAEATLKISIKTTAARDMATFDQCSFTITTTTSNANNVAVKTASKQSFNYLVGSYNGLCRGFGIVANASQAWDELSTSKACPALKTIVWGSTSDFLTNSIACGTQTGAKSGDTQEISLCALTTRSISGTTPTYAGDTTAFQLEFAGEDPINATSVEPIAAEATLASGAGACLSLVNSDLFTGKNGANKDEDAEALLITFTIGYGSWGDFGICQPGSDLAYYARIKAKTYGFSSGEQTGDMCSDTTMYGSYGDDEQDDKTVFCHGKKKK